MPYNTYCCNKRKREMILSFALFYYNLFNNFSNHAGANSAATFTDRKTQTFFHRDRCNQRYNHRYVITRKNHLFVFWQLNRTGYVSRTEVELRTVALEEWCVTTTLFFGQNVDLSSKVSVRVDRTRLGQYLTTLYVFTFSTAQQYTHVITCLTLIKQLAEHLNTGTCGLNSLTDTNDLDLFTNLDHTTLDTASNHCTATRDGEYVLNRHQECTVNRTLRGWN